MNKLEFRMDIPAVTREYNPGSCRNSRKPMRLSPPCEMRPDFPAFCPDQLRFPNQTHKEPRFVWLNSRMSLFNISCIFSIFVSRLFICNSICFQDFGSFLLSLFEILFQIDSLSPPLLFDLVGIFHVPLLVGYFSSFSSCLDCCVWSGLSVFCWSVVPFYCGDFTLWVGLDDWLVKVSWLGKLVSVFSVFKCSTLVSVWTWISSLWSAMECPVMSFVMGLCVRCDFGRPVCWHLGLCSCVAIEFVWYVFFWSFLALGWWLVLV